MLNNQLHFKKIYLVTGRTDLRNGIQGLVALVRLKFGKNPLEEDTLSGDTLTVLPKPNCFPC